MRLYPEDLVEIKRMDSLHKSSFKPMIPGYFFDRQSALALMQDKSFDFDNLMGQAGVPDYTITSWISDEKQRAEQLPRYKGSVVILQGRQDPIGESTAYEIKGLLPQTQIYFIEKCGHMPWLEKPEAQQDFFKALYAAIH